MLISLRKYRLALILVLALPLAARADEASHRAKAEQMMTLLNTEHMVQQNSDNITKQVDNAADSTAGANPSPETTTKVADFKKQATQLIDAQLSWEAMRPGITDAYVKNFTEEEMDGIIAFYKTPAGVALLAKMPAVNSQVTQLGSSHIAALQAPMKQLFETFHKSVTAEPVTPAAPPTLSTPTAPATSTPKPPSPPK